MNGFRSASHDGLIGLFDHNPGPSMELAPWCVMQRGERLIHDGPLQVWRIPRDGTGLTVLRDDRRWAVVVGELYRMTVDDGGPGEPDTKGMPETSRVRNALSRFGIGVVDHLEGQFSLVLWDARQQRVWLAADASSVNKLFFRRLGARGLVWANDLDLLMACPLVEKALSRPSLHEYLRFLDISPPNTIYKDVFAVEPAGTLEMPSGRTTVPRDPDADPGPRDEIDDVPSAVEELDRRLSRAVNDRLDAEARSVAFLSGGVDSALLCVIAGKQAPERVEALTVGFEQQGFDESGVAAAIAAHAGVAHHRFVMPLEAYRPYFDRLYSGVAYPFADPAAVPTLATFERARDLGAVALDGTGADTLLGIMPARHYRWAIEYGARLHPALRRFVARSLEALPPLRGLAPVVDFDDPEELLIRWHGWSRQEIAKLCGEPVSLEHTRFYRTFRDFARGEHLARYSALMASLPDDRVHEAGRLTGLKVRFPYFDLRVNDYLKQLAPGLRYRDGEAKFILKQLLGQYVPRRLWDVPKHGFDFPFVDFLSLGGHALIDEYLDEKLVDDWGLFDFSELKPTIEGFKAGDRRQGFKVWGLVVLFAWLEQHYRRI